MNLNREAPMARPAPDFSDLMRNLIWAPGYQEAGAWFSPARAAAEGITIHETSAWPTNFAGFGFGQTAPDARDGAALANGAGHQGPPFAHSLLHDLLDVKSGRPIRGYLAVGRSLPAAHVLCCTLADDSRRWIEHDASAGESIYATEVTALRAPARRFWRRATCCGPFEFLVVIGFVFETLLADRLEHWHMQSLAAWSRRRAKLGRDVLHFVLDQDPSNRPAVQSWLEQGMARCADLFDCADEVLSAATLASISNQNACRQSPFSALDAAFADLVPYGITLPASPAPRLGSRART